MIKKLAVALVICCMIQAQEKSHTSSPETFSPAIFSDGKLSQENENFVVEILKKSEPNKNFTIVKAKDFYVRTHPAFDTVCVLSTFNYIYIHEKWFDELTQEEKAFMLTRELLEVKPKLTIQITSALPRYTALITALTVRFFMHRPKGFLGFTKDSHGVAKLVGYFGSAFIAYKLLNTVIAQPTLQHSIKALDIEAAKMTGSFSGAISYLKRVAVKWEKDIQAGEAYLESELDTLKSRITNLESY